MARESSAKPAGSVSASLLSNMWLAPDKRAISINFTHCSYRTYRTYRSYRLVQYRARKQADDRWDNRLLTRAALLTAVLLNAAVPQPLPFIQRLARDLAVVEMNLARRQNLISLMTFAGDEDHITRPRLQDRAEDRFAAVDHQVVILADAGKPDPDVVQDQQRVFAARVVGGGDHEIAQACGFFAHQRALGSVAVAAATEDCNHAASWSTGPLIGLGVAHGPQRAGQRVRRMRIINYYR